MQHAGNVRNVLFEEAKVLCNKLKLFTLVYIFFIFKPFSLLLDIVLAFGSDCLF